MNGYEVVIENEEKRIKQNPEMHLPNREKHSITESESYEVGSEEVEVVAKNKQPPSRENCYNDNDDDDVNKKPNTHKKNC